MELCFKNILITISNLNFMQVKISYLKVYYSEVLKIIKYKLNIHIARSFLILESFIKSQSIVL